MVDFSTLHPHMEQEEWLLCSCTMTKGGRGSNLLQHHLTTYVLISFYYPHNYAIAA